MTWIKIIQEVILSVFILDFGYGANAFTQIHDALQDSIAHHRKLKPSGRRSENRLLLIVLFPITLYLVLGTLLLLLLSIIELPVKALRCYASDGNSEPEEVVWHQISVTLTLLFPIVFPIAAVLVGMVFIEATFKSILKIIRRILTAIFKLVRRIWVNIVLALQALVEWFMDYIYLVWRAIIEGTQMIWESIVSKSQQILEYLNIFSGEV